MYTVVPVPRLFSDVFGMSKKKRNAETKGNNNAAGSMTSVLMSGAIGALLVVAASYAFFSLDLLPSSPTLEYVRPPEVEPEPVKKRTDPPRRKSKPVPGTHSLDPSCVDNDPSCEVWARGGECYKNTEYMHLNCRASCNLCQGGKPRPKMPGKCEDTNQNCATWAAIGECDSNPGYMLDHCPVTCKMCQSDTCFDARPDCAERCKGGEASNFSASLQCYFQPELLEECAWTCGACKEHRFSRPECMRDPRAKPAAVPGSVDQIFSKIASMDGATVLSREPWVRSSRAQPALCIQWRSECVCSGWAA